MTKKKSLCGAGELFQEIDFVTPPQPALGFAFAPHHGREEAQMEYKTCLLVGRRGGLKNSSMKAAASLGVCGFLLKDCESLRDPTFQVDFQSYHRIFEEMANLKVL